MEHVVKAVVLGIVQGLTEFLPVSSSGHLLVFRKMFGLSEAGLLLDTMLHFGTLAAVMAVFWRDIMDMLKKPFSHLTLLVAVGTIPTALIGLFFKDFFEELAVSGVTVGWEFLATGVIIWAADNIKNRGTKDIKRVTFVDALVVGTLQGAAILPAISRSGFTIAGALFCGIKRETAARFSFLISVPAIMGAVAVQGADLLGGKGESIGALPLAIGALTSAVAGYVAVKWMLAVIQRGSFKGFAVYVWFLGAAIIILQFLGKF
ncbi:MAG: undecaprenyl-diphosphate phosphatase [Peptococcaceae bacterium]|nr:undecaprenyl-diphosphate phosphatase [Peptococcaceae bacterium]MDH7526230.1 undecaprenyl-diphosphate phosphatase [Peptococcaceae bacterium]